MEAEIKEEDRKAKLKEIERARRKFIKEKRASSQSTLTRFVKPDPKPQYLCYECKDANDYSIRSFKIASCSHFDVPQVAPTPRESEKPEEEPEEEEHVIEVEIEPSENLPEEDETPPEEPIVENKNAFEMADAESSSDSDTSIRHYLHSKL